MLVYLLGKCSGDTLLKLSEDQQYAPHHWGGTPETSIQLSIASTKQLQRHLLRLNPGLFKDNFENLNIHVRFDWQQQYLRHRILRHFPLQHPL